MISPLLQVQVFLSLILLIASIWDLRFQKIPNLVTYPAMLGSLLVYFVTFGFAGLAFSAKGFGLGMALLMLAYLAGGMGAGDVKLMGVVGAALGPRGVFNAFLFTALAGGIYALVVLVIDSGGPVRFFSRARSAMKTFVLTKDARMILSEPRPRKRRLYYGVAIAIGTMCTMLWHRVFGSYLL